jgi:hypothetical protein
VRSSKYAKTDNSIFLYLKKMRSKFGIYRDMQTFFAFSTMKSKSFVQLIQNFADR